MQLRFKDGQENKEQFGIRSTFAKFDKNIFIHTHMNIFPTSFVQLTKVTTVIPSSTVSFLNSIYNITKI